MKRPQLTAAESRKGYTYLALGDSYTIGEHVVAEDNFPNQVVRLLRNKGIAMNPPRVVAKTGWTTDELQVGINTSNLKKRYDFVSLLIGVNNQYRGREVVDYIPQFESLLKRAIRFAGNDTAHVIVISIPDWGATPFAEGKDTRKITAEIEEYNSAAKLIAQKLHVHYIDITPGSRKAASDESLVASDGLHPSRKEYSRWAQEIAEFIAKQI